MNQTPFPDRRRPTIRRGVTPAVYAAITITLSTTMATGCGQTYIDDRATATTAAAVTTTTTTFAPIAADASVSDLIEELAATMAGLSEAIVEQDDPMTTLDRVNEIWSVLQPKLPANSVDRNNLQSAIDLANSGVTAKHPADADKGYRIVNAIIETR